jgi:hypothetical protein
LKAKSNRPKINAVTREITTTVIVYLMASCRVGQVIFLISDPTSPKKLAILLDDFIDIDYQKEP